MATLEKLENLGYVIKIKGKNKYVVNDSLGIHRSEIWGDDLAEIIVYKTIEEALDIKRHFDEHKHNYSTIRSAELEVQLMHKKAIMVARLKASKDE